MPMPIINPSASSDSRKLLSGKDGALFDGDGNLLATVDSFQAQLNVTNAAFQPLGNAQERAAMTSFKVTLTFSQFVIQDDLLFRTVMEYLSGQRMPILNFRGMMRNPFNESEQQIVYRNCVPDGSIDLQNIQVGELVKRSWNWVCNDVPDLQSLMTA